MEANPCRPEANRKGTFRGLPKVANGLSGDFQAGTERVVGLPCGLGSLTVRVREVEMVAAIAKRGPEACRWRTERAGRSTVSHERGAES